MSKNKESKPKDTAGSKSQYLLLIICGLFLLIVLVPTLALSGFARPMSDDFSYAALTHEAWQGTGSLSAVFRAAFEQLAKSYQTWQGTYSSILLFALNSMIFSIANYKIDVLLIQIVFLCGVFFLAYTLLWLSGFLTRVQSLSGACCFTAVLLIYLPYIGQAMYWRNSMVIYTFAIGLECVLFGLLLRLWRAKSKKESIALFVPCAILLAYLGGSNYITALCTCFGLFGACLLLFYRKAQKKWYFLAAFLISLAGLLVTVTAPGNTVRASYFKQSGIIETIFRSFGGAFEFMGFTFLSTPVFVVSILLVAIAKKKMMESSFLFPYPLVVFGVSFVWLAAHFAPTIYAADSIYFEPRIVNTYHVSAFFLLTGNLFYFSGWLLKKALNAWKRSEQITLAVFFSAAMFIICMGRTHVADTSLYKIYDDLLSGAAQLYSSYVDECLYTLENTPDKNPRLSAYKGPALVALTSDSDNTTFLQKGELNKSTAKYFGKDAILVL